MQPFGKQNVLCIFALEQDRVGTGLRREGGSTSGVRPSPTPRRPQSAGLQRMPVCDEEKATGREQTMAGGGCQVVRREERLRCGMVAVGGGNQNKAPAGDICVAHTFDGRFGGWRTLLHEKEHSRSAKGNVI